MTYVVGSGCHQKKVGRGDWIRTSDPLLPKQISARLLAYAPVHRCLPID